MQQEMVLLCRSVLSRPCQEANDGLREAGAAPQPYVQEESLLLLEGPPSYGRQDGVDEVEQSRHEGEDLRRTGPREAGPGLSHAGHVETAGLTTAEMSSW